MKLEELILIFQNILSYILHKLQKERSVSAPYYILIGKRSGHSIQDVGYFQLHPYFCILPKLSKKVYDEYIKQLIKQGKIIENDDGTFTFIMEELEKSTNLFFDGWHYRGNEHLFFSRLSLIVQTLSHKRKGTMNFIPIQKDVKIQNWVRHFLLAHGYQNEKLHEKLYKEITESFHQLQTDERGKNIVVSRLTGFEMPGFTWSQLAANEKLEELDVQLLYISCLHEWLNEINKNASNYPLLSKISEGIRFIQPLTGSAAETAKLFQQGYSIEQISFIRKIKESTVEDHLVELAMNDQQFNIYQFISKEDAEIVLQISKQYNTKKLKVIHERVPHLTFFQLRLALTRGENS